jgi:hypothetical protein
MTGREGEGWKWEGGAEIGSVGKKSREWFLDLRDYYSGHTQNRAGGKWNIRFAISHIGKCLLRSYTVLIDAYTISGGSQVNLLVQYKHTTTSIKKEIPKTIHFQHS